MFRQASTRYPRSKGFKVKHAFQIALLVAVSIWLLYQVKHSHDKKQAYEEKLAHMKVESSDDGGSGWNSDILGRKGKVKNPEDVGDTVDAVKNEENTKEEEETVDRHDTLEENGTEDHGVGDDELDRHEDEKTEEESQEEHERIREDAMNNEGKESEAEEEEQNGDVGANFMHLKQENGGTEEATEAKDEHNETEEEIPESKDKEHNKEQSLEDKNAENLTEHNESEEEITESKDKEHNHEQSLEDKNAENLTEHNESEEEITESKDKEHNHEQSLEDKNAENLTEHNESEEEITESKDKEHNHEQSLEDKNAGNQTEIEHGLDHPLATGGEDMERNSTKSVDVPKMVLEQNETTASSVSSEGENGGEKSSDTVKIEEVVSKQDVTSSLEGSKDVPVVGPNTEKEGKKLEEKNQEANSTLSDSVHDLNAGAEGKKRKKKNKEAIIAEEHEIGMEDNATAKHESQADSSNGFHELATSESKNGTELTGQIKSDNSEPVSSVNPGAAEGEVGVSHNAMSEDFKGLTSLDKDEAKSEHNSTVDHETTSETDNASEGNMISTSSERNSTMESVHSEAGDAISQDMPEENEVGDHTDLGTLPESEAQGQTTEELAVQ